MRPSAYPARPTRPAPDRHSGQVVVWEFKTHQLMSTLNDNVVDGWRRFEPSVSTRIESMYQFFEQMDWPEYAKMLPHIAAKVNDDMDELKPPTVFFSHSFSFLP